MTDVIAAAYERKHSYQHPSALKQASFYPQRRHKDHWKVHLQLKSVRGLAKGGKKQHIKICNRPFVPELHIQKQSVYNLLMDGSIVKSCPISMRSY